MSQEGGNAKLATQSPLEHRAAGVGVGGGGATRGGGGARSGRLSDCSSHQSTCPPPPPLQAAPASPLAQVWAQSGIRRLSPDGVRGRSPQRLYASRGGFTPTESKSHHEDHCSQEARPMARPGRSSPHGHKTWARCSDKYICWF